LTLTLRDKIILLVLIFSVGIYLGYNALWVPAHAKVLELKENKLSIENLAGDITPLKEETKKLKEKEAEVKNSVNNIKSLSGGLTSTKEEFLVFLGDSAKENSVDVSGFNDLGTKSENGIYRAYFDFELKGNSANINKVLEDIENMGIKCSFGSISYRQNETYDYLKRFFDDLTELTWYKEKEEEEKEEKKEPEQKPEKEQENINENEPPLKQEQNVLPEEKPTPVPVITPEPSIVPEEKEPPSIEDRLNELLEQTASERKDEIEIVFLTNNQKTPEPIYKAGQNMRLSVTVCLVMYNEPTPESSFLNKTESGNGAVL